MGLVHDAYLFEPESFLSAMIPYMEAIEKGRNGYSFLRSAALDLYDRDPRVRSLAEEYGGWDKNAILTQLPSEFPQGPEDTAFWFAIFLYRYCSVKSPRALGLGDHWRLVNSVFRTLGWSDRDRHLLINGNRFTWLARRAFPQANSKESLKYWNHVGPFSQGGQAGWLDFPESYRFLERIAGDRSRLEDVARIVDANFDNIQRAHQVAFEMVAAANEARSGLCLIISG